MNKKYIIISFISIIFIISISLFIPNTVKNTYAAGTTLADTVIGLSGGSVYDAGVSGVYYTNSAEYRYIGAEPNNYVKFNNDLYRIIGVFNDATHGQSGQMLVKLIRSRILGSYLWGAYNTTATSGTFAGYSNDWTGNDTGVKANLNVLLNEFFYNKTDYSNTYGDCGSWTYYLYWVNTLDSGSKITYNAKTKNCSDIVGYGLDATSRTYIQDVVWRLQGRDSNAYSKANLYKCERDISPYSIVCLSGGGGAYDETTTAKIGLMYASDYMYASAYYNSTSTVVSNASVAYHGSKNWLYQGYEYVMNISQDAGRVSFIHSNGKLSTDSDSTNVSAFGVRPSFYLKASVYVTGGDGSFANPYTIACDNCG